MIDMVRSRSMIAGDTDYTGVSMNDILSHLRDWRQMTTDTVATLQKLRDSVRQNPQIFEEPKEVEAYLNYFCDLFNRYAFDFGRLVMELPGGVQEAHVEIVRQLYESSRFEENHCVEFKREFITHALKNEQARPALDTIYAETRDTVIDYKDLSNLVPRLRTFVGSRPSEPILQVKPGAWGISLDLRQVWARLRSRWSSKAD
jgi:hypothetical protein